METEHPEKETRLKRSAASCVKFSDEEFKRIAEDAQATGKSIPSLLKTAYFAGRRPRILMTDEERKQCFRELRQWGNNLNQLAKRVNSGFASDWYEEFQQVARALASLENMVLSVYGRR